MSIIESVNPRSLSKIDLEKIVEIEQDMWAREDWLWEYMKCESCLKIHSKEDIFWHLSNDIKIQTVKKIEEIIDFDKVCSYCNWKIESIYDRNEYIESIRDRYFNSIESFLTVYRDDNWEIRWFMDWYIDSFEKIYEREFSTYYSNFWVSGIKKIINENLFLNIPDEILVCTSLWFENKYKNFFDLYEVMKIFFLWIYKKRWWNVFWIAESVLWTNTHSIYYSLWAKEIWLSKFNNLLLNKNSNKYTDLFIHPWITGDYFFKMLDWPKTFLKSNIHKMREVLIA